VRKAACTASVFMAILAIIFTLFAIHTTAHVWWYPIFGITQDESRTNVFTWIDFNVCVPMLAGAVLCALWMASSALCSFLRESRKDGSRDVDGQLMIKRQQKKKWKREIKRRKTVKYHNRMGKKSRET